MRHYVSLIGLVGLWFMVIEPAKAEAQYFAYGGPLILEKSTYFNFGIGGEGRLYKGLAVVIDVSGFARSHGGGVLLSANGAYKFSLSGKTEPFATAGASVIALASDGEADAAGGPNFGGGLTYWFNENRGIRGEYRVHLYDTYPKATSEIRFGYVWK